jgi:uncharacterized membrane protein
MAETSFPIVGTDLTDDAWSQAVGAGQQGILEDWGSPYALVVNTNDTITIKVSAMTGVAQAVVAGFGHQLDANMTVSVPAVTSTTTYWIGLLYDPTNATLPVSVQVLKGTTPPVTSGQQFLPLYSFVRASGQTLAASTQYSMRPRIEPHLSMATESAVLAMYPMSFLYGTTIYAYDTKRSYKAAGSPSAPVWAGGPQQGLWRGYRTQDVGNAIRSAFGAYTASVTNNSASWFEDTNGVITLDPGIYTMTATMTLGNGTQKATGRTFVEIAPSDSSSAAWARGSMPVGEDTTSTSFQLSVTSVTTFRVYVFQTTGDDNNVGVSLNIARIA